VARRDGEAALGVERQQGDAAKDGQAIGPTTGRVLLTVIPLPATHCAPPLAAVRSERLLTTCDAGCLAHFNPLFTTVRHYKVACDSRSTTFHRRNNDLRTKTQHQSIVMKMKDLAVESEVV
jgi:hypothetical protein